MDNLRTARSADASFNLNKAEARATVHPVKYTLMVPLRYLVAVLLFAGVLLALSAGVTFATAEAVDLVFVLRSVLPVAGAAAVVLAAYRQVFAIIRSSRSALPAFLVLLPVVAALLAGLGMLIQLGLIGPIGEQHRRAAAPVEAPVERILEYPRAWLYLAAAEEDGARGVVVVRPGEPPRFRVHAEAQRARGVVYLPEGADEPAVRFDAAEAENYYRRHFEPPAYLSLAIRGFEQLAFGLSRRSGLWLVADAAALAFAIVAGVSLARMTRWPPMNVALVAGALAVVLGLYALSQQPYLGEVLAVFELDQYADLAGPAVLAAYGLLELLVLLPQRPLSAWRQELGYG